MLKYFVLGFVVASLLWLEVYRTICKRQIADIDRVLELLNE